MLQLMLKKDKKVSCVSCTNRAYKNSNITSVTIIITFNMVYLMSEAYSKPCQRSIMIRHIENSGIIGTVNSGIFMHV